MCGICGVVSDTLGREDIYPLIDGMNRSQLHRGPDEGGVYCSDGVGLGHRRLSIIDLAGGNQPMKSQDGKVTIVFNGEIYNYKQLRSKLIKKGCFFSSHSDTEVILNQYLEDGIQCLKKLQGMFAFAIWDERGEKKFFLARDRIGIKPLYYAKIDKGIVFASEIKAILKSGLVDPEIELGAIDSFLTVGLVPSPITLFKGINKLPPGCYSTVNKSGDVSIHRYWDICKIPANNSDSSDIVKNFESEIRKAVKSHLTSDVPVGVFLSGGLDSSAIVALMSEIEGQKIETFSIGYKDNIEDSELGYAELVARHFNTKHHEYILEPLGFFDSMEQTLQFTDKPIDQPSAIALYQLSKYASQHVKVVLSGEGMDEVLGGYSIYSKMVAIEKVSKIFRALGGSFWTKSLGKVGGSEKLIKHLDWVSEPFERRYQSINCYLTRTTKDTIYNRDLLKESTRIDTYFSDIIGRLAGYTMLQKMNIVDLCSWIPDSVLVKADRMSMAASIELRVPFLDHKFVEFCVGLPDQCKISGGSQKHLLREFMKNKLPDAIISRSKKGFPVPINEWFRGELYKPLHDVLTSEGAISRRLFRDGYLRDKLREHRLGKADNSNRLFLILVIELWYKHFIRS